MSDINISNLNLVDYSNNKLTELPTLPSSLENLYCSYNQLTELFLLLPSSLKTLFFYRQ